MKLVDPITEQMIKDCLRYEPETGKIYWTKDRGSVHRGDCAGTIQNTGYLLVRVNRRAFYAHQLAWFLQTGYWPEEVIDHADRDPLNNRWSNLRSTSYSNNQGNRARVTLSGFKGVSKHPNGRYRAKIKLKEKQVHLGYFSTESEAARAYDAAAQKYFSEFARLNFPNEATA